MAISIDPDVKGYINGAIAVCGVIATLGASVFPDYIPSPVAKEIVQTCGLIFAIYGGLNSAGNFLSSSKPGALAPPDPPVVKAAAAVAALPPDARPSQVELVKNRAKVAIEDHQP
jgi:hypothetical protein